jgi:hypothetical protein
MSELEVISSKVEYINQASESTNTTSSPRGVAKLLSKGLYEDDNDFDKLSLLLW